MYNFTVINMSQRKILFKKDTDASYMVRNKFSQSISSPVSWWKKMYSFFLLWQPLVSVQPNQDTTFAFQQEPAICFTWSGEPWSTLDSLFLALDLTDNNLVNISTVSLFVSVQSKRYM